MPTWLRRWRERPPTLIERIGRRVRRRLSPLTLRIMAVNLLSLAILVGTILYLGRYQDRIIEVEADALLSQARIFAGAIAEGATVGGDEEGQDKLLPPLARQMVRRLDEVTDARTRLYDNNGKLLADSWVIGRIARGRVGAQTLPDLHGSHLVQYVIGMGVRFIQSITPGKRVWPLYSEQGPQAADGKSPRRTELQAALDGDEAAEVYMGPDGHLLFSVALPVQRYKQALGALNLTRSGVQVEQAIRTVRTDILTVFIGALAVTLLLSFYLARAIVVPIRSLADAADAVRSGQNGRGGGKAMRRREIPDLSDRQDEIGELSGALRAMTDALWQRMDAIESFAADVAHELKNPLASLRSAIETLAKIKDPAAQEKLRGIIEYDVIRLDRLITDISGASRLDAELSRIALERVDIAQLLTTLVDIYSHQESAAGRVQLAPVTGPLYVAGLETRLVQVLQNVIGNALTFSPPLAADGHGDSYGTVRIAAVKTGTQVRITVDDDGPGIPDAKLEAIFDRFYTERPAGEGFGQHSGLGLSISQQIVEAHRGRIAASNRLDAQGAIAGARFTIELPAL